MKVQLRILLCSEYNWRCFCAVKNTLYILENDLVLWNFLIVILDDFWDCHLLFCFLQLGSQDGGIFQPRQLLRFRNRSFFFINFSWMILHKHPFFYGVHVFNFLLLFGDQFFRIVVNFEHRGCW